MGPLEIISLFPNSYRAIHPNLGDVRDTTFAKGVIKDFKTTEDDPLTVVSMVKVDVPDAEESDFIPIFYLPKKYYWDTTEHDAQDFNQEGNYHDNAWMNFQVGDEVLVMIKEGKPVAIIGFADRKPHIAENILKVAVAEDEDQADDFPLYFAAFGYKQDGGPGCEYSRKEQGPDGNDLNLTRAFTGTLTDVQTFSRTYWSPVMCPWYANNGASPWLYSLWNYFLEGGGVNCSSNHNSDVAESYITWNFFYKFTIVRTEGKLRFGPIPIGPVDYYFEFDVLKLQDIYDPSILQYWFETPVYPVEGHPPYGVTYPTPYPDPEDPEGIPLNYDPNDELNQKLQPPRDAFDTDPATWPTQGGLGGFDLVRYISTPQVWHYITLCGIDIQVHFDIDGARPPSEEGSQPDEHWSVEPADNQFLKMAINGKEPIPQTQHGFSIGGSLLHPENVTIYIRPHKSE